MKTLKDTLITAIALTTMISCQDKQESIFKAITNFGDSDTIMLDMNLHDAYMQEIGCTIFF